jgi:hypothetical protein
MQVGAALYQRVDAACDDLDFNREKRQRGAKKAKNVLAFFAPLCLFCFPVSVQ